MTETEEWDEAERIRDDMLSKNSELRAAGFKINRKGHKGFEHSYMYIDGMLVRLKNTHGQKEEYLGVGGFGKVKAGIDRTGITYALKISGDRPSADEVRFMRECGYLYGVAERERPGEEPDKILPKITEKKYYMLEKFHPGMTLDKLYRENFNTLPRSKQYEIAMKIMFAILEIHNHKIIHCDIKPSNFIVDISKRGKITVAAIDFGIARHLGKEKSVSVRVGGGSLGYIAPEIGTVRILDGGKSTIDPPATGESVYSYASDVYALGQMFINIGLVNIPNLAATIDDDSSIRPDLSIFIIKFYKHLQQSEPGMLGELDKNLQKMLHELVIKVAQDKDLNIDDAIELATPPLGTREVITRLLNNTSIQRNNFLQEPKFLLAIVNNPQASAADLTTIFNNTLPLLKDRKNISIVASIVIHPNVNAITLENIARTTKDPTILMGIAMHKNSNHQVLMEVINNKNITRDVLNVILTKHKGLFGLDSIGKVTKAKLKQLDMTSIASIRAEISPSSALDSTAESVSTHRDDVASAHRESLEVVNEILALTAKLDPTGQRNWNDWNTQALAWKVELMKKENSALFMETDIFRQYKEALADLKREVDVIPTHSVQMIVSKVERPRVKPVASSEVRGSDADPFAMEEHARREIVARKPVRKESHMVHEPSSPIIAEKDPATPRITSSAIKKGGASLTEAQILLKAIREAINTTYPNLESIPAVRRGKINDVLQQIISMDDKARSIRYSIPAVDLEQLREKCKKIGVDTSTIVSASMDQPRLPSSSPQHRL